MDKKLSQMKCVYTIVKFCSHELYISSLLYGYTGLDAAKLFVGVAGNDVMVNALMAGLHITTVNNYLKLLHLSQS